MYKIIKKMLLFCIGKQEVYEPEPIDLKNKNELR